VKKEYFKVYIRDENNDRCLVANCETVCKTSSSRKTEAYIFRDLITQKLILPNYGHTVSEDETTLTYNNYDRTNFQKVSSKDMLKFLKGLDSSYIELYQTCLSAIENRIVEKSLIRIRTHE